MNEAVVPPATEAEARPATGAVVRAPTQAVVRPATEADIRAVAAIYAHHVLHGTATFEIEPPGADEMLRRFRTIAGEAFPYLVAERAGAVVGYAYAATYRPRVAYRFTVEDSIYLAPDAVGGGIGRRLLQALVDDCAQRGFRQMIAVIGDSANAASIGVHRACGFDHSGTLWAVGFKFGRWLDSVLMQRGLGAGAGSVVAGG